MELSLNDALQFHAVADAFTHIFYEEVLPQLSGQLDMMADENTVVSIPRLEIDLGRIRWEQQQDIGPLLVASILQQLRTTLRIAQQVHHHTSDTTEVLPAALRQWRSWAHYLRTGTLHWYAHPAATIAGWEAQLLELLSDNAVQEIRSVFRDVATDAVIAQRLFLVFSPSFIQRIAIASGRIDTAGLQIIRWMDAVLAAMPAGTAALRSTILHQLTSVPQPADAGQRLIRLLGNCITAFPAMKWRTALGVLCRDIISPTASALPDSPQPVKQFLQLLLSAIDVKGLKAGLDAHPAARVFNAYFPPEAIHVVLKQLTNVEVPVPAAPAGLPEIPVLNISAPDASTTEKDADTYDEALYVPYAGLVITAAFLPYLFEALDWIRDQDFTDTLAQHKAVLLTALLATGQRNTPDWALAVPKILCGLPPAAIIPAAITPDDHSVEEAIHMLEAVIGHWTAVGQISPDGLREGFLQRSGKLVRKGNEWLLQVETSAIDVLMERLPWGIGMIQHPWMPGMLRTEWPGAL